MKAHGIKIIMRGIFKSKLVILYLLIFFVFDSVNIYSQKNFNELKTLKGIMYRHKIVDESDSLSSDEIIEFRGFNDLPLWFSRDFFQEVCLTGLCKMVRYRIYWTGATTYLGIEVNEKEHLTKTDHTTFKPEDYARLNRILEDSVFIFRKMDLKDLTIPDEKAYRTDLDGLSGATNPSIASYVVKDAVYTCFTIWHTVYGPTYKHIKSILEQRVNSEYLNLIFDQKNPDYILWGIEYVKKHKSYHSQFYWIILSLIKSENPEVASSALKYFAPSILSDVKVQHDLANILEEAPDYRKFDVIGLYSDLEDVDNDIIIRFLQQYEEDKISSTALSYVYKMINKEKLRDTRIINKLKRISSDENQYVKNITQQVLSMTE